MKGVTSYRLPNGQLIFPFDTRNTIKPPWVIVAKLNIKKRSKFNSTMKHLRIVRSPELGRYRTETEARAALKVFAEKHNLAPAY